MRWLSTVLLLALAVPFGQAQGATRKCTPTYQNHNAIDYGPLVFRNLSGWAIARRRQRNEYRAPVLGFSQKKSIDRLQSLKPGQTEASHSRHSRRGDTG